MTLYATRGGQGKPWRLEAASLATARSLCVGSDSVLSHAAVVGRLNVLGREDGGVDVLLVSVFFDTAAEEKTLDAVVGIARTDLRSKTNLHRSGGHHTHHGQSYGFGTHALYAVHGCKARQQTYGPFSGTALYDDRVFAAGGAAERACQRALGRHVFSRTVDLPLRLVEERIAGTPLDSLFVPGAQPHMCHFPAVTLNYNVQTSSHTDNDASYSLLYGLAGVATFAFMDLPLSVPLGRAVGLFYCSASVNHRQVVPEGSSQLNLGMYVSRCAARHVTVRPCAATPVARHTWSAREHRGSHTWGGGGGGGSQAHDRERRQVGGSRAGGRGRRANGRRSNHGEATQATRRHSMVEATGVPCGTGAPGSAIERAMGVSMTHACRGEERDACRGRANFGNAKDMFFKKRQ